MIPRSPGALRARGEMKLLPPPSSFPAPCHTVQMWTKSLAEFSIDRPCRCGCTDGAVEKLTRCASLPPVCRGLAAASRSDTAFKFRCGQHAEATLEAQCNIELTDPTAKLDLPRYIVCHWRLSFNIYVSQIPAVLHELWSTARAVIIQCSKHMSHSGASWDPSYICISVISPKRKMFSIQCLSHLE